MLVQDPVALFGTIFARKTHQVVLLVQHRLGPLQCRRLHWDQDWALDHGARGLEAWRLRHYRRHRLLTDLDLTKFVIHVAESSTTRRRILKEHGLGLRWLGRRIPRIHMNDYCGNGGAGSSSNFLGVDNCSSWIAALHASRCV